MIFSVPKVWKTFGLLPGSGVSMKLTGEQECLSFMTKFGFLFERGAMLVVRVTQGYPSLRFGADKGNCGRRHCSGALNSYFHKVAHHIWYAHPHFLRTSTVSHLAGRDHSCTTLLFPTCLMEPQSTLIHTELRSAWRELVFYSFSLVWIRSWHGSSLRLGPCSCSYVNA